MESLKIHTVSCCIVRFFNIHWPLCCCCFFFNHSDSWNDWLYQWIGYDNWNYSRIFNITPNQISGGRTVWLKCDGLDTVATVRYTCTCTSMRSIALSSSSSFSWSTDMWCGFACMCVWRVLTFCFCIQHQQPGSGNSQQHAQAVLLWCYGMCS